MKRLRLSNCASRLSYTGIVLESFEVRALRINELYCPVRSVPAFAQGVQASVEREGLRHPVIVVRLPRGDIVSYYRERGLDERFVPEREWLNCVCGGTNRVHAAKELGYEAIDCLLVPDFELAMQIQERHRRTYEPTTKESNA